MEWPHKFHEECVNFNFFDYDTNMSLTTCLWFNGNAREAANFYVSIFPDSSISDNWNAPTDTPGNKQGEEVVVNFKIFGQNFIGLNGSHPPLSPP